MSKGRVVWITGLSGAGKSTLANGIVAWLRTQGEDVVLLDGDELREVFGQAGIEARNHRMLESLLPLMSNSTVFVAVGALHLPGDSGLIALLRKQGYQLRAELLPVGAPSL